jgi:Holliday junction resolvase RusA-like endonuclease
MNSEIDNALIFLANVLPEPLIRPEEQILRYSFEKKSYQAIASDHQCSIGYVKNIADGLWEKLSVQLGESVTRTNCRAVLKRQLLKPKPGQLQPIAEFWINERGMGKARPRKTSRSRKMHMPAKYVKWMNLAVDAIEIQMPDNAPAPVPAYVECYFLNFLSSDSDNLTGAVEDALVKAKYLGNDSSGYVVDSRGRFAKTKKRRGIPLDVGILVKVYQGEIVELEPDVVDKFRNKYPQLFAAAASRKK